jgi:hypothetical protein
MYLDFDHRLDDENLNDTFCFSFIQNIKEKEKKD